MLTRMQKKKQSSVSHLAQQTDLEITYPIFSGEKRFLHLLISYFYPNSSMKNSSLVLVASKYWIASLNA